MSSNDFSLRMQGVEIIYSMLSLRSLDINIILFRNEIISHLITISLINEEDKDIQKLREEFNQKQSGNKDHPKTSHG